MGKQGERLEVTPIHVEDSYPFLSLEEMEACRTFIGYNEDVRIHLGSQDSGHEWLQSSRAPKEGKWVAISSEFSPTVGNSRVLNANLAAKITLRDGLQANVAISRIRIQDLLRHAQNKPALICGITPDRGYTAAMVPETCIVLELAYARATLQCDKATIMKNALFRASAWANGDAVMSTIFPRLDDVLGEANGDAAADTVGTMLFGILDFVNTRREVMQVVKNESFTLSALRNRMPGSKPKPTMTGWEMIDIAEQRPRSDLKNIIVPKLWDDMVKELPDMLVFLCQTPSEGGPIRPYDKSTACQTWTPTPSGFLTMTMECCQLLNKQVDELKSGLQLTPKFYWEPSPSTGSPFDGCATYPGGCANRVQQLSKRPPISNQSFATFKNGGALIFGDVPKSVLGQSCCAKTRKLIENTGQNKRKGRKDDALGEAGADLASQPAAGPGTANDTSREPKRVNLNHDGSTLHDNDEDAMDVDVEPALAHSQLSAQYSGTQGPVTVPTRDNGTSRLDTPPDEKAEDFGDGASRAIGNVGRDQKGEGHKDSKDVVMSDAGHETNPRGNHQT